MKVLSAVFAAFLCFGLFASLTVGQAAGVTGKWHFVLDTSDGVRVFEPVLQQDGDKVTGKWDKNDVKGTFADGKLSLEFPVDSEEAGPGTLKIKGELANEALTGTWEFQQYNGTFKATRVQQ